MALRLIRDRPGDRLSCHHHQQKLSLPHDLTPAPGRQAHTTSPYAAAALVSRDLGVHRIPPHVRDDRDRPSFCRETGGVKLLIWPTREAKYFSAEGWTDFRVICPSCCFVAVRHEVSACTGSDTVPGEPNVCSKIRPSIGLVATAASGPRSRCVPMGGTVAYFVSANGPKKRPQRADAARAAAGRAKNSTAWAGSRSQKQKDPDQQTCCKCPEA